MNQIPYCLAFAGSFCRDIDTNKEQQNVVTKTNKCTQYVIEGFRRGRNIP
jgi:hypothetical protein